MQPLFNFLVLHIGRKVWYIIFPDEDNLREFNNLYQHRFLCVKIILQKNRLFGVSGFQRVLSEICIGAKIIRTMWV
jgi:hypothetical protein